MVKRVFGLIVILCGIYLVSPDPSFAQGRGIHDCPSNAREGQPCYYNNQASLSLRNQRGVCKRDSDGNDRYCPNGNWMDRTPEPPTCTIRMQTSRMYCEVNR
jgi:hypothetical protein